MAAVQLALDEGVETIGARHANDHYRTPRWLADVVLAAIPPMRVDSCLDAGCGEGLLIEAVRGLHPDAACFGVEIDPSRAARVKGGLIHRADFLAWAATAAQASRQWDLVISNPPFRLWDEFVRAMLPLRHPDGTCLVLGFMNILGGQVRAPWWREHPPSCIWLSPRRASFTAGGQTDQRDAAWFCWGPGERRAELRWLPTERW